MVLPNAMIQAGMTLLSERTSELIFGSSPVETMMTVNLELLNIAGGLGSYLSGSDLTSIECVLKNLLDEGLGHPGFFRLSVSQHQATQ